MALALANLIGIASALAKTRRGEADVTGELRGAGIAFGDLIKCTGDAIASTQRQLNDTSATSATALATTKVDVIAVAEKIFDDQGTLTEVHTHVRKLPLVNFIDPVFYEWSSVRLQGTFYAREFTANSSSSSAGGSSRSSSGGPTGGGFGFTLGGVIGARAIGNPRAGSSSSSSGSASNSGNSSTDVSMGTVRMNALLRPRRDIGVTKPNQAIQGPRLAIIEGEIVDVAGPPRARTLNVLLQYHRRDGSPIQGKAISIDTHGVPWQFVDAGNSTTDANGNVEIQLRRDFLDPEANTAPIDVIIEARIGLVANSTTATF